MEGAAPLRFIPFRPPGPVDPEAALSYVSSLLPELDEGARRALADADLVGRPPAREAAEHLARARKALRRASFPLSATGWCERAERLISEAIDRDLERRPRLLLHAHLRRCDRCVEHERRLAQARDALARGFVEAHHPEPEPEPAQAPPELQVIEQALPEVEHRVGGMEHRLAEIQERIEQSEGRVLDRVGLVEQRIAEMAARLEELAAARAEPVAEAPAEPAAEIPVEPAPVEEPPLEPPPIDSPPVEPPPVVPPPQEPEPEPVDSPPAAASILDRAFAPAPPGRQFIPAGGVWQWLFLLAVLLAVAVLVVTALGVAGVERLF